MSHRSAVQEEGQGSTCTGWVRAAQANFYRVRIDPELAALFPEIEGHFPAQKPMPAELLCTARAKLKKGGQQVMVGDWVEVSLPPAADSLWPERGAIEAILPRRTQLPRPAIANITQVLVVMALAEPEPEPNALSRLLVQAEASHLRVQVVFNKCDCVEAAVAESWRQRLQRWGYEPLLVSALTEAGIPELRRRCRDQISVVAGPSGVGKSSLLNRLLPAVQLTTQAVSEKLRQGRHTTRHVELFPLPEGGWIADSPGFNAGEGIPPVSPQQLIRCFPEVRERLGTCQFRDCLHDREPGCGLRELDWERRGFYLQLLHELQEAQAANSAPACPGLKRRGEGHHLTCRKQSHRILTDSDLDWQED